MKLFFNHRLSRTTLTNVRVGGARTPAAQDTTVLYWRLFDGTKRKRKLPLMLACMLCTFAVNAATWYVDAANGSDENAGTSWETALASIQKGIDSAVAHDTILVSRGIYSYIDIPISKIGLTVLAMSGPTDTIIKGATKRRCVTIGDGSVTNIYVEGFTLTAGHLSDSSVAGAGALGGTYNNCVIAGNNCGSLAGGAGAANCTLNGCTISNNIASSTLAGTGGIVNCIASNCVISSNISKGSGSGGADGCTLIECTIIGNKANVSRSGGAYNCTLYRCLLEDNTCTSVDFAGRDMNGGKAYNCIIKANKGSRSIVGANCYNCTIISTTGNPSIWRDTQLYNCIICSTGNAFAIDGDSNWKVNLYNCLLHNVTLGTHTTQSGCLSADPIFISASNLALQSMSPCIDNGNNLYAASGDTDVAGKPRVNGGTVDIGAYEYYPVELSLKGITAKQRYPWNGKVDVQFKLETPDSNNCVVMLFAKDVAGGTNLPMRTVYKLDGTAVNMAGESLPSGTYSWVWDAAADLPDGFECERVTVTGTADIAPFPYSVKFNANGGTGTMADESFTYGTAKALTANAFTRTDYTFQGWATSASGAKVYNDKQSVSNLTQTSGAVVNLYAVWTLAHGKVQLWKDGPYWAETNIGAEKPEEYGYYFWWGGTTGYRPTTIGTTLRFNFNFSTDNSAIYTYDKSVTELQSAGWVTSAGVLAPSHDAAHVLWGGNWRMPTGQELCDLNDKCDWTWATTNGVKGYIVRGRGAYASNSIFLPAAGYGIGNLLFDSSSCGYYWSSVPYTNDSHNSRFLHFTSSNHYKDYKDSSCFRGYGQSVRPVQ